jgi:hypothetical protein
MDISHIVDLQLSALTQAPEQAGFDVTMLLSPNFPAGTDIAREYTSSDAMSAADYAVTDPEYLYSQAYFAQSPRPATLLCGKRTALPTQAYRVDVVEVADATAYELRVSDGTTEMVISITSGTGATNDEIIEALVAEWDAHDYLLGAPLNAYTVAAVMGAGSIEHMTITANTPGSWLSVQVRNTARLAIVQNHASPTGLAADLDAIKRAGYSWYSVANLFNSTAEVAVIAAWTENNGKLFGAAINDTAAANSVLAGATDAAGVVVNSSQRRTGVIYHSSPDEFADIAALSYLMATDPPGSATLHAKTLASVAVDVLTDTQIANLEAKRCSYVVRVGGLNLLLGGYTGTAYFDTVQGWDYYMARAAEAVFGDIAANRKIPYDEGGFAIIENALHGAFAKGEEGPNEFFVPGSLVITMPLPSAMTASDKAARRVTGIATSAVEAGAAHSVTGLVTALL